MALSFALLLVFGAFGIGVGGGLRVALGALFAVAFVVCAKYTEWCVFAYRSFSYDGKRQLSKQIIEGTAEYITLPENGVGLDVGCDSGALTIASAKRNPQGKCLASTNGDWSMPPSARCFARKMLELSGEQTPRSGEEMQ